MPNTYTSDDFAEDLLKFPSMVQSPQFAEKVLNYAMVGHQNGQIWDAIKNNDFNAIVDIMGSNGDEIPAAVSNAYVGELYEGIAEMLEEGDYIPEQDYDGDQSFFTGAEFAGSLQIQETENEKVYVPSSYYCHTKVFNKFLSLQTRGENIIKLEGKGVNPYAMSKTDFLNHIMMYMIKCDCKMIDDEKRCTSKCYINKRKLYENKVNGNNYYRDNSSTIPAVNIPENYMKPSICRVWYDRKKDKVMVRPINKAKQSHPKMCIGLMYIKGTGNHHAVLIKDYKKLTVDDITIKLTKTKELYCGFKKFKPYSYRDPKRYVCAWDIETSVYPSMTKDCKWVYKFNTAAIGYQIMDMIDRKILQECKIIYNLKIAANDESSLFDEFFADLNKSCKFLGIKDIILYAHNSGKFDTSFAKKSTVIKFNSEISVGNNSKSLKLICDIDNYKLNLALLDTLPFTLQSLKDACDTFKTEIHKEEFDIINKTKLWYHMNSSEGIHKNVINSEIHSAKYIKDYLDIHMKVNHNISINSRDGKLKCPAEYADAAKSLKMEEMENMKVYKDWKKYLEYDVKSLGDLIFKVDDMYNEFGFSITNYVGLPGVAMDMMNSYNYNLSKLYVPSDPSMVELCGASVKGGKVIHFKDSWDSPIVDGKYTDYLICIDMNSLYPSAMYACAYPIGHPKLMEDLENFNNYPHYIGEFEITIPNIRYNIHPYKTEKGQLIYPSNGTYIDVYNDVDIRDMIKDGFKVKMLKGLYWSRSSMIFSELVDMIFNKRNDYKSLNPEDAEYAKEYICKILLNSMFGKYNEKIKNKTTFFSGTEEELKKILTKKCRVVKMENGQYRINETLDTPKVSKPTYIAGYVTAYSRSLVNEIIRKVGADKIYYSDTDSLYMKFSDYQKADLKCSKSLCGFKNDYGDGVMITKARFLDIKRCYFEFLVKVDSFTLDRFWKPIPSCRDPVTKKINPGTTYYTKTFKFKYTGINFKDIVSSSALEPDNKLYGGPSTYENYNKIMENTSKIVNKFIANNRKNIGKDKNEIEDVKFLMKRFNKNGQQTSINLQEFAFVVTPEKRGQWIYNNGNREYYALGYDLKSHEEFLSKGNIGDLVNKFSKMSKVSYGMMIKDGKSILRSRRPLFYNIRMHIEMMKENSQNRNYIHTTDNEFIKELQKSNNRSLYIQNKFNDYLEFVEYVKANPDKKDANLNKTYLNFFNKLSDFYIGSYKNLADKLINNDVIYDKTKKYDTDYYIEFFDEPSDIVKYGYENYRIVAKLSKFNKGEKLEEYFEPNFINVKRRIEVNMDKLYPVIMLSTRFNKELGSNNLENWQALSLVKLFV